MSKGSKKLYRVEAAKFNVTKSIRIDSEMANELALIEQFKKIPAGILMRGWIQDRIQAFQGNARYRLWKRHQGATK